MNSLLLGGTEEEELGNSNVSDGSLKLRIESEYEIFYILPTIPVESETNNPLRFWKHEAESSRHPQLSVIAKSVYRISVRSTASERALSPACTLLQNLRYRLHPQTTEIALCVYPCSPWELCSLSLLSDNSRYLYY